MSAKAGGRSPAAARWLGRRSLFRLGQWSVSSYAVLLYLGLVAGTLAGALVGGSQGLPPERFVLAVTFLMVPALIGARLWYVLTHFDRYRAQPSRIWRRSEGGLALFGGLALALALAPLVLPLLGLALGAFWDAASFTMLVGLIFTRVGCLLNGCCHGRPTAGPLGLWLPDHAGQWARRYPTQLLEAGAGLVMLGLALAVHSALPFPGALFGVSLAVYIALRLLLEPLRVTSQQRRTVLLHLALSAALLLGALAVYLLGALG